MHARHFSRALQAQPGRLHFAAHSHHPWPDATLAAHEQCWLDAAALLDRKWEHVLGEVVPRAQGHVARLLGIPDARQVAFAPNTHELVSRLFSCLPERRPARVLTTAHEFHSFRRQARRLEEAGRIAVERVAAEPWDTFVDRFVAAERSGPWDLVFLSHVFFDSGFVVPGLEAIVEAAPQEALVAIDGYHAFCALPIDLARTYRRAFYLGGGYKYAMAGEGACFLAVPPGCKLRPLDTGWYASFGTLEGREAAEVHYADDAYRFWGATFDPSGLYRLNAAMDWLASTGTTIEAVHRHALSMQRHFLDGLARLALPALPASSLVPPASVSRGNFLAFDVDGADDLHLRIAAQGVVIDRRGRRLRFGFGIYHSEHDVRLLLEALARALG
jgi:selenocysteine lyase/cysteine desulfurase